MTRIPMSDAESAGLWRQRLFEAETGMTNYLLRVHGRAYLDEWISVRANVFSELPIGEIDSIEAWKRAFFKTQAFLEKFIIGLFGEEVMTDWANSNAEIYAILDSEGYLDPQSPIRRIARQAELYRSRYDIVEQSPQRATLRIDHCGIWDYREAARAHGVPITLDSPCTYCTRSMAANVRAQGCVPGYALFERGGSHGCEWSATRPGAARPAREARPVVGAAA